MSIIDTLSTSKVTEIVNRVRPRLHIDFFQHLPTEVCLKILGFLDPSSLINTARASREWISLALDRKLWEQLYILEGFRIIRSEVQSFENALNSDRPRSADGLPNKKKTTRLRVTPPIGDGDAEMRDADEPMVKQKSIFGPPNYFKFDIDEKMTDLSIPPSFPSPKIPQFQSRYPTSSLHDRNSRRLSASSVLPKDSQPLSTISSLVVLDRGDNKKKLNWQYLYSQRRRLEANWENRKYTNFQLPHPNYPEEAHKECIYTIQHSGKFLVSGSRDKTLRIWNLDTRRLHREPLAGHNGSVLCLQFDASPEEDLIVSGSSDSTVVLWQFSTGKMIQRLRKAHRESVLNVRFDKHVLVTCSKDKTIKIFNRRPLNPGHLGYPDISRDVHPVPTFLNNYGYNPAPTAGLATKPPYTLIGCLEGHGAAVNAVQIQGHEIVSASGDRTVKVWSWPEQTCTRTLIGHTKGIACVQYDGRRIVSGSSDNEVKVFDKESGLEVASLRAHSNLVRTVQAGFGDLPCSEEEDKEDARVTDNEYFKAVDAGTITRTAFLQRGRPRNAGSRKPEDITAYGAKLPPGGGGGKFGRIVSGSYDETIIIWRRDKQGVWKAQHTLRQEEAADIAARATARRTDLAAAVTHLTATQSAPTAPAASQQPISAGAVPDVDAPTQPFAPGTASYYHHMIDLSISRGEVGLRHILQLRPQLLSYESYILQRILAQPLSLQTKFMEVVDDALDAQPIQNHDGTMDSGVSAWASAQNSQSSVQAQGSTSSSSTLLAQAPAQTQITEGPLVQTPKVINTQIPTSSLHASTNAGVAIHPAPAPAPQPAGAHANHHLPGSMARVFKLQFDARRIICCSQTSVIVGWDFANGDEQIIEASRFFAPIE